MSLQILIELAPTQALGHVHQPWDQRLQDGARREVIGRGSLDRARAGSGWPAPGRHRSRSVPTTLPRSENAPSVGSDSQRAIPARAAALATSTAQSRSRASKSCSPIADLLAFRTRKAAPGTYQMTSHSPPREIRAGYQAPLPRRAGAPPTVGDLPGSYSREASQLPPRIPVPTNRFPHSEVLGGESGDHAPAGTGRRPGRRRDRDRRLRVRSRAPPRRARDGDLTGRGRRLLRRSDPRRPR